jgi:hypothetical protein
MTCEADIPPAFVNAIAKNECAGCGGPIMTDDAKVLMDELADAMERMPNNSKGVAGWLLSNYRFSKIGDAQPVDKFHTKPDPKAAVQQDNRQIKIAENPMHQFLKRTDAYKNIQENESKINANSKIAQMARSIADLEVEEQQADAPEQYDQDEYDDEPPVERGPKRSRALLTGTDLVDSNAAPLTPGELAALAGTIGNQVDNTEEILKLQRFKRVKAQQSVLGGGPIRRG